MSGDRWTSETSALISVAIATAASVWALSSVQVLDSPLVVGTIAEPVIILAALFAWHEGETTRKFDANQWRGAALSTPLIGAVFFAIDIFIGSGNGHYDNLFQAGFHAGSPFGVFATLLVCPVGTIISIGGWIRRSMLERSESNDELEI